MYDMLDILKNIENITETPNSFEILKDFERVIDELDLYVYENWGDGELVMGPRVERYWVTCAFMWPRDKMPDPMGGKRLLDYDCTVRYKKDYVVVPRPIIEPDDVRPGTQKGKLDQKPVWFVEIKMPKKLIKDIYGGHREYLDQEIEKQEIAPQEDQDADLMAEPETDLSSEAPADDEGVTL
jgi:hypothetical protein